MSDRLDDVLDSSTRLLRLLSLLQARPDWPGAELAQRLDVTDRTLRRDVARLRALGYPVHASPGVAGGYRLGAGAALPPLLLDDEEAIAVVLSLRTAANHSVTGIAETSLRALAKLDQVLPARLRHRTAALRQVTEPLAGTAPTADPETLTTIAGACRSYQRLDFTYADRDGNVNARRVEPYRLVPAGRRWYLLARDLDRDDWRTFRVDRIEALRTPGARFTPREPPDATAFVAAAITTAPYRYHARAVLRAPAHVIAERVPPTVATIEPLDETSCVLSTGSNSLDAIAVHLAALDTDFTVLEPPELIERLAMLAERLHRAGRPD